MVIIQHQQQCAFCHTNLVDFHGDLCEACMDEYGDLYDDGEYEDEDE